MATGKELARLMSCGYWKELVISRKDYCSAQIFDCNGKPISKEEAKRKSFCHAKILFKDIPEDSLDILSEFLRSIASTSGESMGKVINEYYGFKEVIIC